jgi:hypothetical protein
MDYSPSREPKSFSATQKIIIIFMEPEGSLPSSQQPTIGPYPEPDQSKDNKIGGTYCTHAVMRNSKHFL